MAKDQIETGIFCSGTDWWLDRPRSSATSYPAGAFDGVRTGTFNRSMNYFSEDIKSRSCQMTCSDSTITTARVSGNNFEFGSSDEFRIPDSSTTSIWNHFSSASAEENDNIESMLQEGMDSSHIQDWSFGILGDSSMNAFKHISNDLDQSEAAKCASPPCQQGSFPFGYSPSIIQSLMEPEEILISNHSSIMNFQSPLLEPSFQNLPTGFPTFPNISSRSGSFPNASLPSQFMSMPLLGNDNVRKIDLLMKLNDDAVEKEDENEPVFKRPRIETPLPTFKVRKEKLGDRVTALQQLVSPFGKNDTASVLHEAVEYIKFLHNQLHALVSQNPKYGVTIQNQHQVSNRLVYGDQDPKEDLRSRGLCLMPISTTSAIANGARADHIWTPNVLGHTFL